MNDPDDAAGGSGDDWEITLSPSISSLSSFAPEDFSWPLQQHLQTPKPDPAPKPPLQPTSPRKPQQPQRDHNPQPRNKDQERDQSRQKQRTPPLQNPIHHQQKFPSQISIPVPNLHTPPPTSPRRRPGLLARSSSGGIGVGVGGLTTPTNMGSTSRLGLHMGIGTGMGVGLGAGLPVSPLPSLQQRGLSWSQRYGRGQSYGDGEVDGDGGEEGLDAEQKEEEGSGDHQSPVHSPSHSLSQSWSVVVGAEGNGVVEEGDNKADEEGAAEAEVGGNSQRQSWDSVATLRDATAYAYHPEHDDADDEGDGSNTHVGEGSDGYKYAQEQEGVQGYNASHGYDDAPRGSEGPREIGFAQGREDGHMSEKLQGYERFQQRGVLKGYECETQHDGGTMDAMGGEDGKVRGNWNRDQQEERKWRDGGLEAILEEDTEGETLPPGRVMLMERLCDLVQRLSSVRVGGGMEDDVIDVLNAKVDEMEELLVLAEETAEAEATADLGAQAETDDQAEAEAEAEAEMEAEGFSEAEAQVEAEVPRGGEEELGTEAEEEAQEEQGGSGYEAGSKSTSGRSSAMLPVPSLQLGDQDIRDLVSPLPWLSSTFKYSSLSISPTQSHPELAAATNEALEAAKQAAQAQADMAERVALETEKLNLELAKLVKKLQARKEESDHLHAILIDRAEAAATRILDLEKEVCDLEDDILSNESELRHLRLKIRAVETLCYEFVHPDADPELFEAIENWKADWVLVRDRMLERKKDRKERRVRLHRAGCVINSLEERENETTLTSLGGLSMSVSMLGMGRSPKKAY